MKRFLFFALAGVLLAGCSSNEFAGDQAILETGGGEISFSVSTPNITRGSGTWCLEGSDAATELGGEFVVYGWKTNTEATLSNIVVFDNYVLKYTDGSSNTTQSNTSGWEYVGYTTKPFAAGEAGVEQFIKYWDYSASHYDFLAWSIKGGNASAKGLKTLTADEMKEGTDANYYKDTALVFQVTQASDLPFIYIANRKTVKKNDSYGYQKEVEFIFRNMAAKVRLGIYETVPGYSVKEVKFYESATAAASNTTPALYLRENSAFAIPEAGDVLVKYRKSDNLAVAKTTPSDSARTFTNGTVFNYSAEAEKKEDSSVKYVGRTSNAATYPTADVSDGYTYAFPHDTMELYLKVDYTLVSLDGKKEEIKVKGATAVVPEQYGKWEANHAYTYLFKISDKTNGSTGGTSDPEGLYPITFDALVMAMEDDNQETVTTVATPSITTYKSGVNVTNYDEYQAGYIDVRVYDQSTTGSAAQPIGDVTLTKDNLKLYTAVSVDSKLSITEASVANCKKNGIVLTKINDGLTFNASDKKATFTAVEGKTYVVEYIKDNASYYKVIKVIGTVTTTFTLTAQSDVSGTALTDSKVNEGDSCYVKVVQGTDSVIGAATDFVVKNSKSVVATDSFTIAEVSGTPGVYKFIAKAGTAGAYTIRIGEYDSPLTVTVNAYEFAANVSVVADGATTNIITLNLGGSPLTATGITTSNFTVTGGATIDSYNNANGEVKLKAANTAKNGKIQFHKGDTVLAEAVVTILQYSFTPVSAIINCGSVDSIGGKKVGFILKLAGTPVTSATTITTTAEDDVLGSKPTTTDASGNFTIEAGSKSGTATVAAPGGNSATITVTNFAVKVYSDQSCGTEITDLTTLQSSTTYYMKFTDDGTAKSVSLETTGLSLTSAGTGIYQFTAPVSSTAATVKYKYNNDVTFTLFSHTF